MMRIAYVINSLEGGGATAPVPDIANVIRTHGAEPRIFALARRDGRGLQAMLDAGLEVEVYEGCEQDRLPALRWLDARTRATRQTHIWTSLTRATLLGQLVGLKRGLPVVSWQHAAWLKPANRRLLRATQRLSRLWIGDSECVTDLTARRLKVGPDRLLCWPIFAADDAAPRAQPWRPGEPVRIGSLGRLHPVKGYGVLMIALALLDTGGFGPQTPIEVAIGGEGAQRAELEAMIARHRLSHVRLVGFVDRPTEFLADQHLYVQPSLSEGFCIAAHQAMQAGLGVVASAVGEMPYTIVDGLSGALVPPGDPKALADALARLLRFPEQLGQLGYHSRQRVLRHFGRDGFAERGGVVMARIAQL